MQKWISGSYKFPDLKAVRLRMGVRTSTLARYADEHIPPAPSIDGAVTKETVDRVARALAAGSEATGAFRTTTLTASRTIAQALRRHD